MELSEECKQIIADITTLFDEFNITLEDRRLLTVPVVNAYFRGIKYRRQNTAEPIDGLHEQVLYGLERDRVTKKF